ncbi:single-stranded-DNA-specific exonuclease RecJ [Candidatus Microgenomates bacterium]|nr:single-stranded-DNA-specific exonuclease RecJ [Candidatus Microgenomates bacterium]
MKWNILGKGKDTIAILLKNRGIKNKNEFLQPKFPEFKFNLVKTVARIRKAVKNKEKIVIYGDYDADGICSTAIMWEALKEIGANVMPFIPSREKEGYGLSKEGIDNIDANLIITVDNGIMAHEAIEYAASKKIDVIIIDHHEKPKVLPKAYSIVHTQKLCAAGISYFVAREFSKFTSLELATIATIADLLPLTGVNRSIVKFGLEELCQTQRVGLKALFEVAGIEKTGTYEVGYMISPRLNASGRIESALTALRLLCTNNYEKAKELATLLNTTNKERQELTESMTIHAKSIAKVDGKIIVLDDESYHQGVIGLVAGKLVEQFYLPVIVIARGETVSKASARSISGFNIIEAIRTCEGLLLNAGGHPMAAGFSLETTQISNFKLQISKYAQEKITDDLLEKTLRVDCELPLDHIGMNLYEDIMQLAPFGMGNPEPTFASIGKVENVRTVGTDGKHLKLVIEGMEAIAFNMGNLLPKIKVGDSVKIAYSISLDTFNFNHKLQLKVKDIKV